jgi:hypothetical protein
MGKATRRMICYLSAPLLRATISHGREELPILQGHLQQAPNLLAQQHANGKTGPGGGTTEYKVGKGCDAMAVYGMPPSRRDRK